MQKYTKQRYCQRLYHLRNMALEAIWEYNRRCANPQETREHETEALASAMTWIHLSAQSTLDEMKPERKVRKNRD